MLQSTLLDSDRTRIPDQVMSDFFFNPDATQTHGVPSRAVYRPLSKMITSCPCVLQPVGGMYSVYSVKWKA